MVGAPISFSGNHGQSPSAIIGTNINPTVNNVGTQEQYAPAPPHQVMYGTQNAPISSLLPYNGQATGPPNMPTPAINTNYPPPTSAAYPPTSAAPPPHFPPCSTIPENFNHSTSNYPPTNSSPLMPYQLPTYHSAHQSSSAYPSAGYPPQPNNPQAALSGYPPQGQSYPTPPPPTTTNQISYMGNLYPTPQAHGGVYPPHTSSTGGVYPHQY